MVDMGRKLKLNEDKIKELSSWVRAGHWLEEVTLLSDISPRSLYYWYAKGKEDLDKGIDSIYSQFLQSMLKAKAQSDALFLSVIRKAAENGVWQAATWYLERSNPRFNKEVQKLQLEADLDELVEEIVVDFD